ncbi:MAG TPA: ABC transporter ATP-binding protein [Ilumatobacteraceae bacterium]|nr:ABC transporter ATP-binding protein [Ilumatobacteraceae bacterium]
MGYMLEARSLRKQFKDVEAVRDIDITVAPGERVGLLGPNGAGKTTTLLMLLGAITPDHGEITIGGHTLPRHRSKAMEVVGFAAGYLPLPDRLKVREALGVFAGWYGVRDHRTAVEQALERFEIRHLADRQCSELSSGQRTLVGIVKATLHEPTLLVLDEPTASLDPDIALKVRSGLLTFCATSGAALLVTSHDMREVELLTERVIFLARGVVVANDTPAAIVATYGHVDLEQVFLSLAAEHGR